MSTFPESHKDLLMSDVAVLATLGRDGYPQVTGLWFLLDDDGALKLSLNTTRQKAKNLREHPECTLFILDKANPYRTIEIRARAEVNPDEDCDNSASSSRRLLGAVLLQQRLLGSTASLPASVPEGGAPACCCWCDLEYARWSNFSYRCASHMTLNLLPDSGLPVGTGKAQLFRCKTPVLIVMGKRRFCKS